MNILNKRNARFAGLSLAAALAAGCGGGGSDAPSAPAVLGLKAVALDQDTTSADQPFQLADRDTLPSNLFLGITTSDATLLPAGNIVVVGTGANRVLRITPAAETTGVATVTLMLRDPEGLTGSATFEVRVNPVLVSFRSLATSAFATPDDGTSGRVSGVTVQGDVDDDPTAFDTLLQQGAQ